MVIVLTVDRKSPQKILAGNKNHLLSDNIVYIYLVYRRGKNEEVIDDYLVITKE